MAKIREVKAPTQEKAPDQIDASTAAPSAPAVVTGPARWKYRVLKPVTLARGVPGQLVFSPDGGTRILQGRIDDEVCYWPAETMIEGRTVATTMAMVPGCVNGKVPSGGHGRPVPVDLGGVIELTAEEVSGLSHGEVEPIDADAPPVPSGLINLIEQENLAMARGKIEGPEDKDLAVEQLEARTAGLENQMRLLNQGFIRPRPEF